MMGLEYFVLVQFCLYTCAFSLPMYAYIYIYYMDTHAYMSICMHTYVHTRNNTKAWPT